VDVVLAWQECISAASAFFVQTNIALACDNTTLNCCYFTLTLLHDLHVLRFLKPLLTRFYRAMLCIARSRKMSFRRSHVGIPSKRLHIYSNFFHRRVATPYFPYQRAWQYSDGYSLNGGAKCKGGMKKCNFWPISRFTSEMIQDRTIFTMEGE